MQSILVHCFGYNILPFKKLIYGELKVVVKECQLPILLILSDIQRETKKHVKGVFPSVKGDGTSHIIDGTYLKCITSPFISEGLDWCCGDVCMFLTANECFLFVLNVYTKKKTQ